MTFGPLSIRLVGAFKGQRSMATWLTEIICDLRGPLEVATTPEATKVDDKSNMHMDARVIEVAEFQI